MNNINIFNSDVVPLMYDVFWNKTPDALDGLAPKPVLIVTNAYFPGSTEDTQLQKMIEACKLVAGQYNMLQLKDNEKTAWHYLSEKLQPKVIFLIGIMPAQLGIAALFRLNAPNNFGDCMWLPTLSVSELEQYKDAKKQLWVNGITPIFINQQYGAL